MLCCNEEYYYGLETDDVTSHLIHATIIVVLCNSTWSFGLVDVVAKEQQMQVELKYMI